MSIMNTTPTRTTLRQRLRRILKTGRRIGWELLPWALLCLIIVTTGTVYHLNDTIVATRAIVTDAHVVFDQTRMEELQESLIHTNDAGQIMANTYARVGEATEDAINHHVAPGLDRMVAEVTKNLRSMDDKLSIVVEATTRQIDQNGDALYLNQLAVGRALDSVNQTIETANGRLAAPEIDQILADLAATGHAVRVTSEDPEILAALKTTVTETAKTSANVAEVTANAAHTTKTVDHYIDSKLYPPPARGFWRKLGRGFKVAATYTLLGGQAGYYVVRLAKP